MGGRQTLVLVLAAVTTAAASVSDALANSADLHLKKGQRHIFAAGSIHVGTQVRCSADGIKIAARVAPPSNAVSTIGDGLHGSATMTLKTLADGRVIATCT